MDSIALDQRRRLVLGLGRAPALVATLIYALPPFARLTELGLRGVERELLRRCRDAAHRAASLAILVSNSPRTPASSRSRSSASSA